MLAKRRECSSTKTMSSFHDHSSKTMQFVPFPAVLHPHPLHHNQLAELVLGFFLADHLLALSLVFPASTTTPYPPVGISFRSTRSPGNSSAKASPSRCSPSQTSFGMPCWTLSQEAASARATPHVCSGSTQIPPGFSTISRFFFPLCLTRTSTSPAGRSYQRSRPVFHEERCCSR